MASAFQDNAFQGNGFQINLVAFQPCGFQPDAFQSAPCPVPPVVNIPVLESGVIAFKADSRRYREPLPETCIDLNQQRRNKTVINFVVNFVLGEFDG